MTLHGTAFFFCIVFPKTIHTVIVFFWTVKLHVTNFHCTSKYFWLSGALWGYCNLESCQQITDPKPLVLVVRVVIYYCAWRKLFSLSFRGIVVVWCYRFGCE